MTRTKTPNDTCVQRVKVVFSNPFIRHEPLKRIRPSLVWNRWKLKLAEKVDEMNRRVLNKETVLAAIEALRLAHPEWNFYLIGDRLVLETTTLDFDRIVHLLEENGLRQNDYEMLVEYERKWGIL